MLTRTAIAALTFAMLATGVEANDPFYKGKRLNLMINFAAGGPADIEGRIFARHFARHIDGAPNIVIQNRDGAGGLVGTNYLGEVAPRDGTMAGYLTAAAWNYVVDPAAYRMDFGTFEFVAYQPANIVYFVRTDTPPGVKDGASLLQSTGLVAGGLCRQFLEGPQDPALARYPRRAVQIRHRVPQRRAGAACPAARRDQLLLGVVAELFRLDRARTGEDRRGDPGLVRPGL